jgi:hypothetical protein
MSSGTITVVDTSPTLIYTAGYQGHGAIVQNSGETPVFLGTDATVAASGTAAGLLLAPSAILMIPFPGSLYGIVASGTGTVAFIAEGGTA